LHDAFQIFQSSIGTTFFKCADDFIGVKTTDETGRPRTVTLKNKKGVRISLKERSGDELWVFWIFPMVERSQQLLCPYEMEDWEHLIEMSERASSFIPLPILKLVHHGADDAR